MWDSWDPILSTTPSSSSCDLASLRAVTAPWNKPMTTPNTLSDKAKASFYLACVFQVSFYFLLEIFFPWILYALTLVYIFFTPPGRFWLFLKVKCYCSPELFPQPISVPELSLAEYSHPFLQLQSVVLPGIHRPVTAKQLFSVHA